MKFFLFLFIGLLFPAILSLAHAQPLTEQTSVSFHDRSGTTWNRWIITERHELGLLLLVVDNPSTGTRTNQSLTQKVIFRKFFPGEQFSALKKFQKFYFNLSDHPDSLKYTHSASPTAHSPLWLPLHNEWTLDDEQNYTKWYEQNVSVNFLKGTGIHVDCADFAVAVRWAYAHDKRLPVANSLAGSEQLIGHWIGSTEWDQLGTDPDWRKDERFKAALHYVLENTYTHSIFRDLYPVRLDPSFITPGIIYLTLRYNDDSGHTRVINSVGKNEANCGKGDCLTVMQASDGSEGLAIFSLDTQNLEQKNGGFLRWRWPTLALSANDEATQPSWKLVSSELMPGYSLEQYSHPEMVAGEFEDFVYKMLNLSITPIQKLELTAHTFQDLLQTRKQIVRMGVLICGLHFCSPESAEYEIYSTPNRDQRIREFQQKFLKLLAILPYDPDNESKIEYLNKDLQNVYWTGIVRDLADNGVTPFSYLYNIGGVLDRMSSDPNQGYLERWGVETQNFELRFQYLTRYWIDAFNKQRDPIVSQAINLCYGDVTSTQPPHCDPAAPEVQELSTGIIDDALRILRKKLRLDFPQVSEKVKKLALIQFVEDIYQGCTWHSVTYCTGEDILFSDHDMVERMSSNPTDPYAKRFGL